MAEDRLIGIPSTLDFKQSVRAGSIGNINLSSPGASIDGVSMGNGQRFLAKDQNDASENGIYVWLGANYPARRALDASNEGKVTSGQLVYVEEGGNNGATWFFLATENPILVDDTDLTYLPLVPDNSNANKLDGFDSSDLRDRANHTGSPAADVDFGANKITNLADPTVAQDAATKNYVDTEIGGVSGFDPSANQTITGDWSFDSGSNTPVSLVDGLSFGTAEVLPVGGNDIQVNVDKLDFYNDTGASWGLRIVGSNGEIRFKQSAGLIWENVNSSNQVLQTLDGAFQRFVIKGAGNMEWGPGGAGTDVTLSRSGVGVLANGGALTNVSDVTAQLGGVDQVRIGDVASGKGGIGFGSANDARIWREGSSYIKSNADWLIEGQVVINGGGNDNLLLDANLEIQSGKQIQSKSPAATVIQRNRVSGAVENRFEVLGSGQLGWGGGALAVDTNLYRSAAGLLKTDNSLEVAGTLDLSNDGVTHTMVTDWNQPVLQVDQTGATYPMAQWWGDSLFLNDGSVDLSTDYLKVYGGASGHGIEAAGATLTISGGSDVQIQSSANLRIGTASSSLIGFHGATPVDQAAHIPDPSGGATIDAEARTAINAILVALEEKGILASL